MFTERGFRNSSFCRHICHPINCTCRSLFQQNDEGGCILYYKTPHLLAHGHLGNDTYPCSDGDLIPMSYVNDIVPDCEDADDEYEYKQNLRQKTPTYHCDDGMFSCIPGHSRCHSFRQICI